MPQRNVTSKNPPKLWQVGYGCVPLENEWLQVGAYDEDIGDQNGKPSTLPFPLSQSIIITSIAFWQPQPMQRLQNTVQRTLKKNKTQLGSNAKQGGEVWHPYRYATQLGVWWYY